MTKPPASEATFQMSAAHLTRTLEAARVRVRTTIANLLTDHADAALGEGQTDLGEKLHAIAAEVRAMNPRPKTAAPDPLDRVDEIAPTAHDPLPPAVNHDDFTEGTALVRGLGARGRAFNS